jgi:asparagine synthase (glutamine-hydrolysing)
MYVNWITYFQQDEKERVLHPSIQSELGGYDARQPIRDVMSRYSDDLELAGYYTDLTFFLPLNGIEYVSKSTRPHDLGVLSPLLSREHMAFACGLPMSLKLSREYPKYLLRKLASRRLPSEVLSWSKIGFNSPVGIWLREEPARGMIADMLGDSSVERRGLLRPEGVKELTREFSSGSRDVGINVWTLMFLEAWCREHLD